MRGVATITEAPKPGLRTGLFAVPVWRLSVADHHRSLSEAVHTKPAYGGTCKLCHWYSACMKTLQSKHDLTLLPELGRAKRDVLFDQFETISDLADANVEGFIRGNPAQVVRVEAIQSTISDWLNAKAKPAKQLRAEVTTGISPSGDIAAFVSENRGRALIDQVRRLIADFKETESRLLDQRQSESTNAKATAEANFTFQTESEATRKLSQQLLIELAEIRINALDMETGMRGYLLAGKSPFLAPYESGRVRFDQSVARALELAEDDEALTAFLLAAHSTIREWTDQVVSPSIALRGDIEGASSMEDLAALIAQAQGKQFFDQFRDAMSMFEQAAGKRIQSAKHQSAQIRHDTFCGFLCVWWSRCL